MKKSLKTKLALCLAVSALVAAFSGCSSSGSTSKVSDSSAKATSAAKDDSWDKVQKSGKLILGLDDSFPPMGYVDEKTGEIVGFDIDIAREACKRLNIELQTQPIDWDSKTQELNSGNIDCIWNGFTKTDEREKEMNLSEPYMKNTQVIMVKNTSTYKSRDDLKGKTVAVQSGSSGENAVNDSEDFKNSLGNVIGEDNYLSALMELENGTVDAVVLDEKVATNYMKEKSGAYRLLQKDGKDDFLTEEEYVIGFRKADEALKNKIVGALKEMVKDGKMAEISKKWFDADVSILK